MNSMYRIQLISATKTFLFQLITSIFIAYQNDLKRSSYSCTSTEFNTNTHTHTHIRVFLCAPVVPIS